MFLPELVREKRRRDQLSLRTAAKQMGLAPSTLSRMESGHGPGYELRLPNVITILHWLGGDPKGNA
jgi:transcriptional regulator with XRE-family HTH domain